MKCVLCGKTSIEVKIDLFPLSSEARKMLPKQFGINPNGAFGGVCRNVGPPRTNRTNTGVN